MRHCRHSTAINQSINVRLHTFAKCITCNLLLSSMYWTNTSVRWNDEKNKLCIDLWLESSRECESNEYHMSVTHSIFLISHSGAYVCWILNHFNVDTLDKQIDSSYLKVSFWRYQHAVEIYSGISVLMTNDRIVVLAAMCWFIIDRHYLKI